MKRWEGVRNSQPFDYIRNSWVDRFTPPVIFKRTSWVWVWTSLNEFEQNVCGACVLSKQR